MLYKEESIIKAITLEDDIAKITIIGVPDKPGIAFKLFNAIAQANIKIESIVQNVNRDNINDITYTASVEQLEAALAITREFGEEIGALGVVFDDSVARLSVIGGGMVSSTRVAAKFFKALYEIGVNIQMITTSEVKISCVINKSQAKDALKQIYREFEVV